MKIKILAVGRLKNLAIEEGMQVYQKRLKPWVKLEIDEIRPYPAKNPQEKSIAKHQEALLIQNKISQNTFVVALDEQGSQQSTLEWVSFFERLQNQSQKELIFLIGGAYGLDPDLVKNADLVWSLSDLTFPHELVRWILVEQIYRVYTVIKGTEYHH